MNRRGRSVAVVGVALALGCRSTPPAAERGVPAESASVPVAPPVAVPSVAVPSAQARAQSPGWLGLRVAAGRSGAAEVAEVVPGTPAARGGLLAGDVVVGIGEHDIAAAQQVNEVLATLPTGEAFELRYRRGTLLATVRLALESMPDPDELLRLRFVGQAAPSLLGLATRSGAKPPQHWLGRRVTLVEFWASWCGTCQLLAGTLNDWHTRYGQNGLSIVGVTREPPDVALPVADRLMLYPVAFDPAGRVSERFDVRTLPLLFVLDDRGVVLDVMRGFDSTRIAHIDAAIDARLGAADIRDR